MEIQSTTNYKQFKKMKGNRHEDRSHINKLKVQMALYPELAQFLPILVNEKMEIVDGQHTAIARQEMLLPIFYVTAPGLTLREVIALNTTQKIWTWMDYARSYADQGNPVYITYLELFDEYKLGHKTLILALDNFTIREAVYRRFKNGDFTITSDMKDVREFLSLMEFCNRHHGNAGSVHFARAMALLFKEDNFDTETFKTQFVKFAFTLAAYVRVSDAYADLKKLYNKDLPADQRV